MRFRGSRRSLGYRSRTCRPKLKRIMPSYVYSQPPWFEPIKYMEYENFLIFQERMCVIFQLTMIMFSVVLMCLILSMFLDTLQ